MLSESDVKIVSKVLASTKCVNDAISTKSSSNNGGRIISFITDTISMIILIALSIIILYSVVIDGADNLLSVHIFGCITWFVTLIVSCCYDDVIMYVTSLSSRKKRNNNSKNSADTTVLPSCSVEYNEHVLWLIGLFTYSVALVLVLLSIQAMTTVTSSADTQRTTTTGSGHHTNHSIDFMKDSSALLRHLLTQSSYNGSDISNSNIGTNITSSVSGSNTVLSSPSHQSSNQWTEEGPLSLLYWYYIFGIMAQYHNIVNMYHEFFARNYQRVTIQQKAKTNWMKIEDTLIIPTSFVCMIMINRWSTVVSYLSSKFVSLSELDNDDHTVVMTINTILLLWITHKIIQYGSSFFNQTQSISSSSLWTLPPFLMNTPLASVLQKSDWKEQESDILTKIEIQKQSVAAAVEATSSVDEVANSKGSQPENVWKIYGNTYDMKSYIPYHPGGKEAIMLGANRGTNDCTALFQSYHAFNIQKAKSILSKYQINTKTDDGKEKSANVIESSKHGDTVDIPKANNFSRNLYHDNDVFYSILCQRVQDGMKEKYNFDIIRDARAPSWRWLWYSFLLSGTIISLVGHCKGYIFGSLMFGLFGEVLGCTMGHDSGHYAISHIAWLNDLGLWAISVTTNPVIWQHQHTYGHHQFTNHADFDPDLHHFDGVMTVNIKETNEDKKKAPYFVRVFTYIYVLALFSASTIGLTFWGPVRFVIDRSQFGIVEWTDRKRWVRTIGLILHWTAFTTIILIVPFYVNKSIIKAGVSIGVYYFSSGLYFGLVTQIGHLNDFSLNRPLIEENRKKRHVVAQNSWAADQCEHTNNFCPQSMFSFLLASGLNLQIEHHLFPGINHCHLLKIQPIVEQVCAEYNVSYKTYDSFFGTLRDCLVYMTRCAAQNLGYQ